MVVLNYYYLTCISTMTNLLLLGVSSNSVDVEPNENDECMSEYESVCV